jgi:signal transduction histidine kinase
VSIEDAGGMVACSPSVLYSIASNLVANALKYLGEATDRRVRIRVRARNGALRVEVVDAGPGVSPSLARIIFDPYVRGPNRGKAAWASAWRR